MAILTSYPPPACVIYHDLTLTICPPDPLPLPPVELIGYNIYVDEVFLDNLTVLSPTDTLIYEPGQDLLEPGQRFFCVKAVYNQWISEAACDTATVIFGFGLPFFEGWVTGGFSENNWKTSGPNWQINVSQGKPAPSALFSGTPVLSDYRQELTSFYFRAEELEIKDIYLSFDLKLESLISSGEEYFFMEIWDWEDDSWTVAFQASDLGGSFDWTRKRLKINDFLMGKCSRIRFVASGTNSESLSGWLLDNITLERVCKPPSSLFIEDVVINYRILHYYGIFNNCPQLDIRWDDGENFNAIGTGGEVEFDVAARWLPGELDGFEGYRITQVGFFPHESNAEYMIRVWQGAGMPGLVFEQPVIEVEIDEWNIVDIDPPLPVDLEQELWVGYNVNAYEGYPAGCDDGPALDGRGNMMNFGGWQTLLQINPELDYNWNIFFRFEIEVDTTFSHVNIYRQCVSCQDFELIDTTENPFTYTDSTADPADYYCYKVNVVYANDGDTCISPYSNTDCEIILLSLDDTVEDVGGIEVFPNPASSYVTIRSRVPLQEVSILNSMSSIVYTARYMKSEDIIDVSHLGDGLYLFKILTGDRIYYEKVIVLH